MGWDAPVHKYKPEEFVDKVNECISKCKEENDEYEPCPAQLYSHLRLTPARVSQYRNSTEEKEAEYTQAIHDWYNYLEIEGVKDYKCGNGKLGDFLTKRVLKYSETQVIEQTNLNMDMSEDEKAARVKRLRKK